LPHERAWVWTTRPSQAPGSAVPSRPFRAYTSVISEAPPALGSAEGPEAERYRVLAVDDQLSFLRAVSRVLAPRGFDLLLHDRADAALAYLSAEQTTIDIVLIDRKLANGIDGFDVLKRVREIAPDVSVIVLTGDQRDSTAATALQLGAFHFITKPIDDFDAVTLTLLRAAHFTRLQRRARSLERRTGLDQQFGTLVGSSPVMRTLYARMAKVAENDLNVLVHGESGTGKELVACAIHDRSARARGPFVALNCGAIPEALIDSELFGHTKGAFTGASEARPGVFVEADGGTLLLDEIGELPAAVQSRLLRVLQEREVRAIGASGTRAVDVRVIAATHVDLDELVKAKRFRPDLFYRLNVVSVWLPPLRERVEDIPLLVAHLLEKHAAHLKRPVPQLSHAFVHALERYPWPGNVRELENTIQCALALNSGQYFEVDALPAQFYTSPGAVSNDNAAQAAAAPRDDASVGFENYANARRRSIDLFEHNYFVALLQRTGGNLSEASRLSGIDRSNLRRALAKAGLRASRSEDSVKMELLAEERSQRRP
jgi:DNA-binding NtrC family response regulator